MIANTPAAPYYAVIFSSLRTEGDHGYGEAATRMLELAREQPGFLGAVVGCGWPGYWGCPGTAGGVVELESDEDGGWAYFWAAKARFEGSVLDGRSERRGEPNSYEDSRRKTNGQKTCIARKPSMQASSSSPIDASEMTWTDPALGLLKDAP